MEQKFVAGGSRRRENHSGDRGLEPGAAVLGGDERTHDVFEVTEDDSGRGKWNVVGEVTKDELGRLLVIVRIGGKTQEMELLLIDRAARPIPLGKDAAHYPTHELLDDGGFSERVVGVAFLNRDGSHTLVIDDGKREGPKVRLQMRRARAARSR